MPHLPVPARCDRSQNSEEKRSRLTLGLEIAEPAVWVCVSDSGLSSAGRSVAARELRRGERRRGQI